MESEPKTVVLVCLENRTREVDLPTDVDLNSLEEAVRSTFSDVSFLTDSCKLILQVWYISPILARACLDTHVI